MEVALKMMQDRGKLLGLYPEQRPLEPPVQVNNNQVIPILSEPQRTALESALLRRIGQPGAGAVEGGPEPQKLPSGTPTVP